MKSVEEKQYDEAATKLERERDATVKAAVGIRDAIIETAWDEFYVAHAAATWEYLGSLVALDREGMEQTLSLDGWVERYLSV